MKSSSMIFVVVAALITMVALLIAGRFGSLAVSSAVAVTAMAAGLFFFMRSRAVPAPSETSALYNRERL